jgi:hypothetical protein
VNKPINLYYFYLCIHIFFSTFFTFLFFIFYFLGLAQRSPHGLGWTRPARSMAQASDPAGLQARVVQTTRALHRVKNYLRPVLFSIESNVQK